MKLFLWLLPLVAIYPDLQNASLFVRKPASLQAPGMDICKIDTITTITNDLDCGRQCKFERRCVYFTLLAEVCVLCLIDMQENKTSFHRLLSANQWINYNLDLYKAIEAKDCADYRKEGFYHSGIYNVMLFDGSMKQVYCDMKTDGGGWTVFQRRVDGSENFYRTWAEYDNGFGNLAKEFWLGNRYISSLTTSSSYQLRIDLADFEDTYVYEVYDNIKLDSDNFYQLNFTTFRGTAGDSLTFSKLQKFSTKGKDLDSNPSGDCSAYFKAAWWYNICHHCNLNGQYLIRWTSGNGAGVTWTTFRGQKYSLRFTEMKIRPHNFQTPYEHIKQQADLPRDCADYRDKGVNTSGIYSVRTTGVNPTTLNVYCDIETSGGGWLVFQRRMDGSENFYRNWQDYKNGFGDLNKEFWLGNENLASITEQASYELRVDLEDFENNKSYANYASFSINRNDKYRMWILFYSGNAGDSMQHNNGYRWSTYDADNDNWPGNCAMFFKGPWWHNACHSANLNGMYLNGSHSEKAVGVNWYKFRGHYYSLKYTDMKIRPSGYTPPG